MSLWGKVEARCLFVGGSGIWKLIWQEELSLKYTISKDFLLTSMDCGGSSGKHNPFTYSEWFSSLSYLMVNHLTHSLKFAIIMGRVLNIINRSFVDIDSGHKNKHCIMIDIFIFQVTQCRYSYYGHYKRSSHTWF